MAAPLLAPCAAAQEADTWRLNADQVDRFIAAYRDEYSVPGVAVVVTNGRQVVYAKVQGHDSAGRPMTPSTRLPIASLSKSFTALAVMQLAEDGKIGLDDPVRRYLLDFDLADIRGRDITVRQLLAHTSGMSDMTFPEKSVPTPDSLEHAVILLRSAGLAAAPGDRKLYHNPNYWLAARLVEVVGGKDFDRYLEERVFAPLGMHDTTAVISLRGASDVAQGYVRLLGYPISLPEPSWFLGGCCGVVTTAEDLGRWLAFQNTGVTQSGDRLISVAGMNELHRGLGWNADERGGRTTFTHNGILFTFSARQYVVPDIAGGLGIAVVTNTGIGLAPVDSDAIAEAVLAIAEARPVASGDPSSLVVDIVLGSLCLITASLGAFALTRAKRWAAARRNRARWLIVVTQLPCLLPVVLLAFYPTLIGIGAGGRDLSWIQSLYISALLFVLVVTWTIVSAAVMAARFAALRHTMGRQTS